MSTRPCQKCNGTGEEPEPSVWLALHAGFGFFLISIVPNGPDQLDWNHAGTAPPDSPHAQAGQRARGEPPPAPQAGGGAPLLHRLRDGGRQAGGGGDSREAQGPDDRQWKTAEVTRLVTDGTENACSMLYRAAWRAWKEMGGERMITYILNTEPGTSLKAAGFVLCYRTADVPNGWDRPSRRREPVPQVPKQLWEVRRSKAS